MILEGNITIPYRWTTGPAAGRFLTELRDNRRLVGGRCGGCGKVYAPPPDVCGACFALIDEFVALSGEGTVVAVTTVHEAMPWSPVSVPYRLGLIRLDGADTEMVHLVAGGVTSGDRVRARFKRDRAGAILDIDRFGPISESVDDMENPRDSDLNSSSAEIAQVTSLSEAFQLLQKRFQPGKTDKPLVFYFSIEDEKWTVTIGPNLCEVTEGKQTDEADCYLKTSKELLLKTLRGEYTPSLGDFLAGRIKSNNPQLLLVFKQVFGG